nr:hypothetical protein [Tanacetum cinerariifolium]
MKTTLKIDLFTEHSGYDIMSIIVEELHPKKLVSHVDSNSDVKTNHPDDVAHVVEQFEHDHKVNVKISRMTTDDTWLNKLVGNGTFIGHIENSNPNLQGIFLLKLEDPDDELVESKFKAKKNVSCPSFNPDTPWNECKPVLGMRFESPQQLHMLANYGVQHGYQLWYIHKDHNKILVFYGRNVSEGKCAGLKGKKPITIDNVECESRKQSSKKGDGSKKSDGRKAVNEIIINAVKERWNKKEYEKGDELNLRDEGGINMILDGHKGLMQAIADWLPNVQHIQVSCDSYKRGRPAKSSASSNRGGSKGGERKRGRGLSKRGRCSRKRGTCSSKRDKGFNTMPLQGLKDESEEHHQFKMDMEAMYEIEREQIENDEDDRFWEDRAREFDHVEEPNDDKVGSG